MADRPIQELKGFCDKIRVDLDAKDAARERALPLAREVIRNSASAIRAVHRREYKDALDLMDRNAGLLAEIEEALKDHPGVYYAGFVHDAQKEYSEARQTYALIKGEPLPDPDDLRVGYPAYLNGLGEALGELRRHALDRIRHNDIEWTEGVLAAMDEIYYALVSFDHPSALSGNLKRTADIARSLLERTRGDLTNAIRQQRVEVALSTLEKRLDSAAKA